jgi:hypothetical protein
MRCNVGDSYCQDRLGWVRCIPLLFLFLAEIREEMGWRIRTDALVALSQPGLGVDEISWLSLSFPETRTMIKSSSRVVGRSIFRLVVDKFYNE